MKQRRTLEKTIATASFIVAVALSFISLAISEDHDIASGTLMVIAQFLTLCATILGIDYKFSFPIHDSQRHPQQQPIEHSTKFNPVEA